MGCVECMQNSVEAKFCPICGSKLSVESVGEKLLQVLVCVRHGEMKVYLDQDPFVSAAVVEHCNSLGIKEIEEASSIC